MTWVSTDAHYICLYIQRRNGWKYQKRPGVDALLLKLVDFYEIVVFTSESSMSGHNLLTALDPNGLILYKLFRDSTNYMDGIHVKVGVVCTCRQITFIHRVMAQS